MKERPTFSSRFAVIAATVGSAIGLGNVWRFPATAGENGGAAFLLIYVLCVFILGIPCMLAEMSLGRSGRSDAVGNFMKHTPGRPWWIIGAVGLLASYLILSFYMVVAGWTLEYLWASLSGGLFDGYHNDGSGFFVERMNRYVAGEWGPLLWTGVMIVLNLVVLLRGVQKGIERMSNALMPIMFVLLLVFCYVSLTLPGASAGLTFFLKPDFSEVTFGTVLSALGQAFFSLSLGMGILVTYSAYYPRTTKLVPTAISVSMLDFLTAFLMGLIIFPAAASFGIIGRPDALEGTTLVFVTLPEIFASMPGTVVWSALFFLLLAVAAATSTISIAEVSVAFLIDRFRMTRRGACLLVVLPLVVTSSLCSLSLGGMPELTIAGESLFNFVDNFATNILLPVSAIGICAYVGWVLPRTFLPSELGHGPSARLVGGMVRWLCPVLIAIVLVYGML